MMSMQEAKRLWYYTSHLWSLTQNFMLASPRTVEVCLTSESSAAD